MKNFDQAAEKTLSYRIKIGNAMDSCNVFYV